MESYIWGIAVYTNGSLGNFYHWFPRRWTWVWNSVFWLHFLRNILENIYSWTLIRFHLLIEIWSNIYKYITNVWNNRLFYQTTPTINRYISRHLLLWQLLQQQHQLRLSPLPLSKFKVLRKANQVEKIPTAKAAVEEVHHLTPVHLFACGYYPTKIFVIKMI